MTYFYFGIHKAATTWLIELLQDICNDLNLNHIPQIRGLNKMDLSSPQDVSHSAERLDGIPICARNPKTLMPLIEALSRIVEKLPRFID